MSFGFALVTEPEFETYKKLLLEDPNTAEEGRWNWESPKVELVDGSSSLSRCVCDDYSSYRDDLKTENRDLMDRFLKPTVFSTWVEGSPITDLETRGYEFSGAISKDSRKRLVESARAIDFEDLERVYTSNHELRFDDFRAYLSSWIQLLESTLENEKYLIIG